MTSDVEADVVAHCRNDRIVAKYGPDDVDIVEGDEETMVQLANELLAAAGRQEKTPEEAEDAEDTRREKLYAKAWIRWGQDGQLPKAAEEFSELAAVLSRAQNGQASTEEILEETVDARIMLEQLEDQLRDERLDEEMDKALQDLEDRLGGVEIGQ